MQSKIIEILNKNKYKNTNQEIFTSKEFIEFLEKPTTRTINLYRDSISTFLSDKLYDSKKNNFNYECIGKIFLMLVLFVNDTTTEPSEILKSKKELELYEELKQIYFDTMLQAYINSLNGSKGGAPKGNNNAKKGTAANDTEYNI